jgi:hypothetical protein
MVGRLSLSQHLHILKSRLPNPRQAYLNCGVHGRYDSSACMKAFLYVVWETLDQPDLESEPIERVGPGHAARRGELTMKPPSMTVGTRR